MDEYTAKRIKELIQEQITLVSYDPTWPGQFKEEKQHLRTLLPHDLINRIEHFGSTAVPGMSAKPIIDILVEVTSLDLCKKRIVPLLISEGYEYFWRPTIGNKLPYYAWFIKRNNDGKRTHHIHMVEKDSSLWDAIFFRDYLRQFPDVARVYEQLKYDLAGIFVYDRVSYTKSKTKFIEEVTKKAKDHFN
jgi:GrpB-like predicted nucleotidyltransferase (UPF0157 family)